MPELIPAAPGSPEWLAARRAGVTATDIVTILGLSSWSSPYSLYWQKLGQVPETPDSDRFRLGRALEPYVRERWALACEDAIYGDKPGLYRSSDRPWQMATPDGILYRDDEPAFAVLELKTWADADRHHWADAPPATVRAQVLWQMDVMGVAMGHVGVVFLPSGEFRSYVIEHDPEVEHDANGYEVEHDPDEDKCAVCIDLGVMQQAGREFMWKLEHFQAPDPDASAATLAAVRARFARTPDKQAEIDPVIFKAWEAWKARKDNAETEVRAYEIQLREQAGEASVLTVDGQPVARRITGDAQVKAHTRHNDYLRRIAPKEADSELRLLRSLRTRDQRPAT